MQPPEAWRALTRELVMSVKKDAQAEDGPTSESNPSHVYIDKV